MTEPLQFGPGSRFHQGIENLAILSRWARKLIRQRWDEYMAERAVRRAAHDRASRGWLLLPGGVRRRGPLDPGESPWWGYRWQMPTGPVDVKDPRFVPTLEGEWPKTINAPDPERAPAPMYPRI